ncbi:DUF4783 domain-containing protein [Sphingobacterium pedocola]|uniref:DUF4783 domain-containing protein n=1 Tax=Sphingobacterium pedocola TaxID=2082722 RepID=A0ABR9T6M0_9SPHI|nr:DUF4783 domain-containing protein [Sphingobacterium pedocola]MBE8720988.1 DUF4783 domain-containing protein [Sphingobacterium pedocola]
MGLLKVFIFIVVITLQSFVVGDIHVDIYNGLKNNNSKALSQHFATTLSLSINKEESVYSKFQAELLLSDFFRMNKTVELKQVQKVSGNSISKHLIYNLKTAKKSYRVFVKLIDNRGEFNISELRIE